MSLDDEVARLLRIVEHHSPEFKYQLTRLHLSEDQIEAIYPLIVQFIEKTCRESLTEARPE